MEFFLRANESKIKNKIGNAVILCTVWLLVKYKHKIYGPFEAVLKCMKAFLETHKKQIMILHMINSTVRCTKNKFWMRINSWRHVVGVG